jgi:excisionase family DNA binding protein
MLKKDVLTTGQVAQLCNVAPRTVTKWFDSGQLRGYRIPGSKDRRIPLNELLRFMKAHDIPTDSLQKGKLRILIIDSRVEYAHTLAESIQLKGSFDIECAHNVFEAGLLGLKFSPNIILLDLMSSDIDAHQICSYVQQTEELQDCSLIALAGGLSEKEADTLRRCGFDRIIIESSNINKIVTVIQDVCSIVQ